MSNLSPDSIDEQGVRHFKILAKRLRQQTGCKNTSALEQVAQAHGFSNWNNVLRFVKKNKMRQLSSLAQENPMENASINEKSKEKEHHHESRKLEVTYLDLTKNDRIISDRFGKKIPVICEGGRCEVPLNELTNLGKGTVLELNTFVGEDLPIRVGHQIVAGGASGVVHGRLCCIVENVGSFTPSPIKPPSEKGASILLSVEIGRTVMFVEDILNLKEETIIPFQKTAQSPMDIMLGDQLLGYGEIVKLDKKYGVRVLEVSQLV